MAFAIIETGGKQYRVAPGDKLKIERISAEVGSKVSFDKVLLKSNGETVEIGTPYLPGAKVEATFAREGRDKKKIIFRYHSKTRYRKKKGHRQYFSEVQIEKI